MIRHLTRQEVEHFDEHGYVAPIRVMTPSDAGQYRARVEKYFQHVDDAGTLRTKAHLHCPALIELVRLPAILDPITDLLGPDVLCRSSSVFLKEPRTCCRAGRPSSIPSIALARFHSCSPLERCRSITSGSPIARSPTSRSPGEWGLRSATSPHTFARRALGVTARSWSGGPTGTAI